MTKSDPEVRVTSEQLAAWETRINTLCRTGRGGPWGELSLSNDESRQLIAEVRRLTEAVRGIGLELKERLKLCRTSEWDKHIVTLKMSVAEARALLNELDPPTAEGGEG